MNSVEFNDSRDGQRFLYTKLKTNMQSPKLVTFLIKKGIVKNEKNADVLLIILVVILLILAASLFSYGSKVSEVPSTEDVIRSVSNK